MFDNTLGVYGRGRVRDRIDLTQPGLLAGNTHPGGMLWMFAASQRAANGPFSNAEWEFIGPYLPIGEYGPYPERLRQSGACTTAPASR
ncbi:hypothetical protein [Streptomyces sp. NPDC056291]|uniref:hypothetical protein n=1 Tax=unclassified Streptomyces TaxID=2593676 RepID=UPI0035D5DF11